MLISVVLGNCHPLAKKGRMLQNARAMAKGGRGIGFIPIVEGR